MLHASLLYHQLIKFSEHENGFSEAITARYTSSSINKLCVPCSPQTVRNKSLIYNTTITEDVKNEWPTLHLSFLGIMQGTVMAVSH